MNPLLNIASRRESQWQENTWNSASETGRKPSSERVCSRTPRYLALTASPLAPTDVIILKIGCEKANNQLKRVKTMLSSGRSRHVHLRLVAMYFTMLLLGTVNAQAPAPRPVSMEDTNRPIPAALLDSVIKPFARLKFPSEASTLSALSNLENNIFRPEIGDGPFPAVVLVPTCGGTVQRPEIRERTKEFLEAGYLVLVLENYRPRGQTSCRNGVVTGALVWKDAVDALSHLHTMKQVDKSRIYQVGYSLGAGSAAALSSRAINDYFGSPLRFRAAVGWYGSCAVQSSPTARTSYLLRADMEIPVLMLMSEGDKESPPRPFCFPLLEELKAAGKSIGWHLYEVATHSWDTPGGYILNDNGWGERVVNQYDAATTADATRRTLLFLDKNQ